MKTRKKGLCPHCGGQLFERVGIGSGRLKSAYYEANGIKKHINDWATELKVSYQTIKWYMTKKKYTMQEIWDRFTAKNKQKEVLKKPSINHLWKKPLLPLKLLNYKNVRKPN